jgi:hypothetical protein
MEVIANSRTNIQFTDEAKIVFRNLVRLDGVQRLQKAVFFEQLYELWTMNGLISERIATKQFEENRPFIFEAILDSFEEERKQYMITIESIHNTLKCGSPYMMTDDKVIHCTDDEKKKYRSIYYNHNHILRTRFKRLLGEFLQFIDEKNSPLLPIEPLAPSIEAESLVPDPPATRESLDRNAKAVAIVPGHFADMTTDTTGNSKRKGGKMGKNTNLDDSKKVNKDLYFTSIYYFINYHN